MAYGLRVNTYPVRGDARIYRAERTKGLMAMGTMPLRVVRTDGPWAYIIQLLPIIKNNRLWVPVYQEEGGVVERPGWVDVRVQYVNAGKI